MSVLRVEAISKKFGSNQIIKNLSFEVQPNQIYGFLGQNGAGKTTVMKMILGLHTIDSGQIFVNDEQVSFGQTSTNKYIGYAEDVPAFYDFMNAREYLNLCGVISKIEKNELSSRINEMLQLVGLDDNKKKISGYSRGMRQRLGIASALLHKPLLLICDEPTSSLDPIGRKQILDILKDAAKSTTIIFSTHILTDVERICDHVAILHHGGLVINDSIESLSTLGAVDSYQLEFADSRDLQKFEASSLNTELINEFTLEISNCNIREIYDLIHALEVYPTSLLTIKPSLEKIFLEVTNESI